MGMQREERKARLREGGHGRPSELLRETWLPSTIPKAEDLARAP
jgi:hypothetical protein